MISRNNHPCQSDNFAFLTGNFYTTYLTFPISVPPKMTA